MNFILLLTAVFLLSCHSKKPSQIDLALAKNDTALAKKLAQKELDSMRASIKDSNFANTIDASLQIQTLEFALEKDSSRNSKDFSEVHILNHSDGQRLYTLMMKQYKRALEKTSNTADIIYFTNESSLNSQEWLKKRFADKKTYEALTSLFLLQKDIALISAIESNVDTESLRQELEKSYSKLIKTIQKNH